MEITTLENKPYYKKLSANWVRRIGFVVTTLATVVLSVFIFYSTYTKGSESIVSGTPRNVVYIASGVAALIGAIAFFGQITSILKSKFILSAEGIEIKRLFRSTVIPIDKIIRVDGIFEKAMGMPTQNRSVFKIITNLKTYEVNSYEFLGLRKALAQWQEHYNIGGEE
jgi:hypothetical protein